MKNLLVITCGKDSLHTKWNNISLRSFDLCLLVYDNTDFADLVSSNAKYIIKSENSKWHNIYTHVPYTMYNNYEQIGILDEDMETTVENINLIFDFGKKYNFDLYAPALTHDSYYSHSQTLQQKRCDFRITNTVEQMCPFFSVRAYDKLRSEFVASEYAWGYGLEFSFENILKSEQGKTIFGGYVGIIDKYAIKHTRKITNRIDISEPEINFYRRRNNIKRPGVFLDYMIKGYKFPST